MPLEIEPSLGAEAVAAYGARSVLVRPDHFVAWAGEDVGEGAGHADAILSRAVGRVPSP